MFNGRVRINLPQTSSLNEDLTVYTLYPGLPAEPPVILREIGSYFRPIAEKKPNTYGIFVDENNTITTIVNQDLQLQIEAYSKIDIVNGQVTTKIGEDELKYVWKKDGVQIRATATAQPNKNKLQLNNLRESDSGAYTCEVTNDVGTVVSDILTIVVQDPLGVAGLYSNLIVNGNGSQQLRGWIEISTGGREVAVETMSNNLNNTILTGIPSKDAAVRGYVYPDHFNNTDLEITPFNPTSEVDANAPVSEKEPNKTLLGNLTYFTRSNIVNYDQDGSKKVQIYQDVDISLIEKYTKGVVNGVEGVEITLQCFLGNAISYFLNKKLQLPPAGNNRVPVDLVGFQLQRPLPRLQPANLDYVEVRAEDYTAVYVEEYNGASLIKTHGPLLDPYRSKVIKQTVRALDGTNTVYYTGYNVYENAPFNEQIGRTDNLYNYFADNDIDPSKHSLGQLIFLRQLQIPKLNENTNKLRVKVIFEHEGFQQFEFDAPGDPVKRFNTNSILLMPSYTRDIATNKSSNQDFVVSNYKFKKAAVPQNPTPADVFPLYGQPRHFATGFYLSASPIYITSGQASVPTVNVVVDTSNPTGVSNLGGRREFGQIVE